MSETNEKGSEMGDECCGTGVERVLNEMLRYYFVNCLAVLF